MAKKDKERPGYFYESEENAINEYLAEKDDKKREKIFSDTLYPAFSKMVESIIRRYKLHVKDEAFDQTYYDTLSYLLTKMPLFRPLIIKYEEIEEPTEDEIAAAEEVSKEDFKETYKDIPEYLPEIAVVEYSENPEESDKKYYRKVEKRYKAYSYCGTICKHYLIQKNKQQKCEQDRTVRYDVLPEELIDMRGTTSKNTFKKMAGPLIERTREEIRDMVNEPDENGLNKNEAKVGKALVNLLDNWEDIFIGNESNKLQKSSVLYFLREETMMSTKEIRDNMRPFKSLYYVIKEVEFQ